MDTKYQSKTIQKGLDVLNLFKTHNKLSYSEIRAKLNFSKATLYRVLYTLENNNYLSKDKNGRYELGMNIFILGHRISKEYQLKKISDPIIQKLSKEINLTVHVGILNNLNVIIVNKANPNDNFYMVSRIGSSVPPHCTGQGKTLLAFSDRKIADKIINANGLKRFTPHTITNKDDFFKELNKINERGYAIDNSEHQERLKCFAVPILNTENKIEAALSVSGFKEYFKDEKRQKKYLNALKEAKSKIELKMGFI
ncbi:MAG: IclR family transcriptional regulator [Bacillota bacterium]